MCRNLDDEARQRGAAAGGQASRLAADEAYADLVPMMLEWRSEGLSQQAIAGRLNAEGHTTRRGKEWNYIQVARVLRCAESMA